MNLHFLYKLLGRVAMVCAVAGGMWFIFFHDSPIDKKKTAEQQKIEKKKPATSEKGEIHQPNEGTGGGIIREMIIDNNLSGSRPPKRDWRKIHVIHLHLPDDAGSRELVQSLEDIRSLYPEHVFVSTIDVTSSPQKLAVWRVSRAPAIVFQAERERLSSFEEILPKPRLTKKIEELVFGLVRVDKNWRPEVKGLVPR